MALSHASIELDVDGNPIIKIPMRVFLQSTPTPDEKTASPALPPIAMPSRVTIAAQTDDSVASEIKQPALKEKGTIGAARTNLFSFSRGDHRRRGEMMCRLLNDNIGEPMHNGWGVEFGEYWSLTDDNNIQICKGDCPGASEIEMADFLKSQKEHFFYRVVRSFGKHHKELADEFNHKITPYLITQIVKNGTSVVAGQLAIKNMSETADLLEEIFPKLVKRAPLVPIPLRIEEARRAGVIVSWR